MYSSSVVIDHLELHIRSLKLPNVGLAYYYCQFDRQSKQDERGVIAAIIRQLAARKTELVEKYKDKLENKYASFKDRRNLLISLMDNFETVFILIDALDEFSNDHDKRIELVKMLTDLFRDCDKMSLLITSRHAKDAMEEMQPDKTIELRASREDITKAVKEKLSKSSHARKLISQDVSQNEPLENFIIEGILEKSDRM